MPKLKHDFLVPSGRVTVKLSKGKTRDYGQGQMIPAGSEVIDCKGGPASLRRDLGLDKSAEVKPGK